MTMKNRKPPSKATWSGAITPANFPSRRGMNTAKKPPKRLEVTECESHQGKTAVHRVRVGRAHDHFRNRPSIELRFPKQFPRGPAIGRLENAATIKGIAGIIRLPRARVDGIRITPRDS